MAVASDITQDDDQEWRHLTVGVRKSLGMDEHEAPWTSTHVMEGVNRANARHRDLIQVAFGAYREHCRKNKQKLSSSPDWCVDLTQQVDRHPWAPEPRSFNKGSLMYCFAIDRILTSEDNGRNVRNQISEVLNLVTGESGVTFIESFGFRGGAVFRTASG